MSHKRCKTDVEPFRSQKIEKAKRKRIRRIARNMRDQLPF